MIELVMCVIVIVECVTGIICKVHMFCKFIGKSVVALLLFG